MPTLTGGAAPGGRAAAPPAAIDTPNAASVARDVLPGVHRHVDLSLASGDEELILETIDKRSIDRPVRPRDGPPVRRTGAGSASVRGQGCDVRLAPFFAAGALLALVG